MRAKLLLRGRERLRGCERVRVRGRLRCEGCDASGCAVWAMPVGCVELTACLVFPPRRAVYFFGDFGQERDE